MSKHDAHEARSSYPSSETPEGLAFPRFRGRYRKDGYDASTS